MKEENRNLNTPAATESFGEAKKSEAALREEQVLEFWKTNKIFEKSLEKKSPKGEFIFYDGPPTANGMPGIHHLLPQSFKDAIPRYKTMRGYHVRRKGGWDTHGLPVELQVEKELGLKSKKEIENYGIVEFNKKCKESVWKYVDVWHKFRDRVGYWVDEDNSYVTYHNDYIESLWNIVEKINNQKLLFKDYKVVPWCPRCGTALSSHELAQGYQDDKDLSVTVKFKVKGQNNTFILAWTTTPWTLPGNLALAVGEKIDYVKVKKSDEIFILAKERISILDGEYEIMENFKGKDLVGFAYEPLYPYFADIISESEKSKLDKAYKVYPADFVTTEDGMGVVHTAVMYGQDDFILGTKIGLPKHHLVDPEGKFMKGTGFLEGRFVKDEEVAVDIIKDLARRGLLFKKEKYEHSYPHCWRCKTPLIYYARDSWYIRMSDPNIKCKLINENEKINWEPDHIQNGRFGEWLKDVKDWAISRERYWGTPLPVWVAEDGEKLVIDSYETLKKYSKKSGNKYFVMRHGGTKSNQKEIVSYSAQATDDLTEKGVAEVKKCADVLRKEKIDYIITSPFVRTKETAEIAREIFGLSTERVVEEPGLQEINPGDFDGKNWNEFHACVYNVGPGWFDRKIAGGESLSDVKKRTAKVLYGLEEKYKGKNILLVTHGGPAWLLFVNARLFLPDREKYYPASDYVFVEKFKKFENAEVRELPFVPIPHNEDYELDPHRPFIDQVVLEKDGKEFRRVKEVMDVWFDSGAMPFAQDHYPFENKKWVDGPGYPADYISEAIDQTRGWFYTLHAVGMLMARGKAFKNVICLGHLLDAAGKKMSKSLGNIVDPWMMIEKYGVDTLRLWMYSINSPGKSKNFDEKNVALLGSQIFGLLYNILAFYELYRDRSLEAINFKLKPSSVLDQWILARLEELISECTKKMDDYKLLESVRAIKEFIGDLSTWYLRRSRERIKNSDQETKQTLYYILKTLSKLMAPFAPFSAEDIWQKLKNENGEESVHLENWPKVNITPWPLFFLRRRVEDGPRVIKSMEIVRRIVTLGLEARQKAGIKVRQPLPKLEIKHFKLNEDYIELIKDELNVKEVIENKNIETEIMLYTEITPELRAEGEYREFMRELQDKRKKLGLLPRDKMVLPIGEIYKQ